MIRARKIHRRNPFPGASLNDALGLANFYGYFNEEILG
jgi:hypothetical protein